MKHKKVILAIALCLTLVAGAGIGGTAAYLATKSDEVVNTFTYGDITIKLEEHEGSEGGKVVTKNDNLKIIPGQDIFKDPFITIKEGSEPAWIYVAVKKENWPASYVNFTIDDSIWEKIEEAEGIEDADLYGTKELKNAEDTINIIKNKKVIVGKELTKPTGSIQPKLTFTAYAIQQECGNTAENAWKEVNTSGLSKDFKDSVWTK